MSYRYFSQRDFDNCTPPCSIEDMNEDTLAMLDKARDMAGVPFVINSAYRTVEHELSKGRDGTSSHTTGRAVDIRALNGRQRWLVISALIEAGFTRLGIGKGFIHVDNDSEKDPKVVWVY